MPNSLGRPRSDWPAGRAFTRPCAVQREHRLLFWRFTGTKHIGRHSLNRLGIVAVVLVGLHMQLDELHVSLTSRRESLRGPVVRTLRSFRR